ncbi:class I SAM-dependent methyltransferase [Pyrinomonas methylaliphatogenes]|jgi:ubiquinone/menaquinone biosynthesis C-methylase UbiE|uniref:Methylase involved in ubiquinone/menaquinone biosynthesis n=1 Tax=Pyrinomonas methylaliphatogenes TaxID=454194 RepID=A0A0B6WUT7_9BACT|nr:class I SAM-dependent methyltransferase [Pyrinomonas methylaliphatogenes]CDM64497.1 methylase involved in ubiquinone/menaquinone biosynthesis [Pyrinomonas methylaliphatogenes]
MTCSYNSSKQRAIYDRFAPRFDRFMRPLEERLLARLRARAIAMLPSNGRVIEIGAGTGVNFNLYPMSASVIASEPNAEMIRLAQEKRGPKNIQLVRSVAEDLPFSNGAFDAALATLVFCSVRSPRRAFAELKRVTKSGGPIVLIEHVRPAGWLGPLFDLISLATVLLFDDHFNRRTAREAEKVGLHIERIEPYARGIFQLIVCRA